MKEDIQKLLANLFGMTKDSLNTTNITAASNLKNATPISIIKPDLDTHIYKKIQKSLESSNEYVLMKTFHKNFFIPFINQHSSLFSEQRFPFLRQHYEIKSITKLILSQLHAYLYADKDIFLAYMEWIPPHFKKAMQIIIEQGEIHVNELKEACGYDPISYNTTNGYNSDKAEVREEIRMLFLHKACQKNYSYNTPTASKNEKYITRFSHVFTLHPEILHEVRMYLPRPVCALLNPITLPENTQVFQSEENLFTLLDYSITYIEQGKLELTKTGKISIPQIAKMQKFLGISEFFPTVHDKELAGLRTNMWANLLCTYVMPNFSHNTLDKNMLQLEPIALAKKLLLGYISTHIKSQHFMLHLNGSIGIETSYQASVWEFFKKLNQGEWIHIDNIWHSIVYDNSLPTPTNMYDAQYMSIKTAKHYLNVNYANYTVLIEKPIFYSNLFILASLGMIDLALDEIKDSQWAEDNNLLEKYITPLDGLVAIRLTALGAFMLGKNTAYTVDKVEDENVQLDENSLYIFYNGNNQPLRSIIQQTARSAGTNLYKVDYETVLGDCANHKQVQSKINIFQKLLSNNPPKIWKDFFQSLQQKSYQLKDENDNFRVFRLPQNPELINLIAREASLKKYILKAEGYMVLIRRQDVSNVKKQLKNYGFLVDFLTSEV